MMDKEKYKIEVGKRLRKIISDKYVKQCAFAAETGISETQISKYVNGDDLPDFINLAKITKAAGISADYILFGKDMKTISFKEEKNNSNDEIIRALSVLADNNIIAEDPFRNFNFIIQVNDKQDECIKTLLKIASFKNNGFDNGTIENLKKGVCEKYDGVFIDE